MPEQDVAVRRAAPVVMRYGLPVLSVAVSLLLTYLFQPWVFRTPLFFVSIMLSTWYGGTGPGLVAVLLSSLSMSFALSPHGIFATRFPNVPNLVAFLLTAMLVGSWSAVRRRAEEALLRVRDELEVKVEERTASLRQSNEQLQHEIAARQQTVEALRESEGRFAKAFRSSPATNALVRLADGRILDANDAFTQMFGYGRAEAIGRTTVELGLWVTPADWLDAVRGLGEGRPVRNYETRACTKSSALLDVLLFMEPIELAGEPCFLVSAYDITERKRAKERLRRTNEELRALAARLQSVREEESARIAREIHDELGATLSSLRWDLEEVEEAISEDADPSRLAALRQKLSGLVRLTETILDTVRRIASELRPVALEELGLAEALQWYARQFQERTGIPVECHCFAEGLELSLEHSTALFRIFQEALTNVLRHAQATRVEVTMRREAGEFVLTVEDNGKGIAESEKSAAPSLGILGMRERASLIGGEISIAGAQGQGTVITMRVPLPVNQAQRRRTAG